jgi:hypothetical protein
MFGLLAIIPGLATAVFGWLNKQTDAALEKFKTGVGADTTINVEEIRARTLLAQGLLAQRKADADHWFTAWMVPAAFGVALLHYAGITLDSLPLLGHDIGSWKVPPLPGAYAGTDITIVLTICGVAQVTSAVRRIFK